jgi:OmpA-OmpF porin, OOP family
MTRSAVLALVFLACVGWMQGVQRAEAAPVNLPTGFVVPGDFHEDTTRRQYWDFDAVTYDFTPAGQNSMTHQKVEGHLWRTPVSTTVVAVNNPDAVVTLIATDFEKDGWTILRRQGAFVAHKPAAGHDLWVSGTGNSSYFSLVLMETAAPGRSLVLPPPKAEVETVASTDALPYFLPLPGSKMEKTINDHRSFEVALPGSAEKLFAVSNETRWYDEPAGVSSYEFVAVYRKALETAGWVVVRGQVAGDAVVIAHFAKNGRDIWLYTRGDGTKQNINVADYGAQTKQASLRDQLAKDGHVALYGIYFDTDLSTPRPESEATLQNVLKLLRDDATLRLEVQGHTDDVGTADHNAKLSDARAASVKTWLTGHGIAADRLTSKGYGATKPVADNHTPEGRAKNRRVELAKQ